MYQVAKITMSQLGDALFTITQQKVLGLLFTHPEKSFYTKQIIRSTGMGVATIKRELDRMLAAGIITMMKVGNQHHYQANGECPIYDELIGIVRKTFGVVDVLKSGLAPLADEIDFAFVYGSIAKGNETARSDVDLMVIADGVAYADLIATLSDAEQSLARTINPTLYEPSDFMRRLREGSAFIMRVMEQPKLWVLGDEGGIE